MSRMAIPIPMGFGFPWGFPLPRTPLLQTRAPNRLSPGTALSYRSVPQSPRRPSASEHSLWRLLSPSAQGAPAAAAAAAATPPRISDFPGRQCSMSIKHCMQRWQSGRSFVIITCASAAGVICPSEDDAPRTAPHPPHLSKRSSTAAWLTEDRSAPEFSINAGLIQCSATCYKSAGVLERVRPSLAYLDVYSIYSTAVYRIRFRCPCSCRT